MDAIDTKRQARFWATATGLVELEREDDGRWIVLGETSGLRRLGIQRSRAVGAASRLHLDLRCAPECLSEEIARLLAIGARVVRPPRQEPYGTIANLADPEGNPFDVCAYDRASG